ASARRRSGYEGAESPLSISSFGSSMTRPGEGASHEKLVRTTGGASSAGEGASAPNVATRRISSGDHLDHESSHLGTASGGWQQPASASASATKGARGVRGGAGRGGLRITRRC